MLSDHEQHEGIASDTPRIYRRRVNSETMRADIENEFLSSSRESAESGGHSVDEHTH